MAPPTQPSESAGELGAGERGSSSTFEIVNFNHFGTKSICKKTNCIKFVLYFALILKGHVTVTALTHTTSKRIRYQSLLGCDSWQHDTDSSQKLIPKHCSVLLRTTCLQSNVLFVNFLCRFKINLLSEAVQASCNIS